MAKIIDINKHGIRREIDHQYKPKRKGGKKKDRSNNAIPKEVYKERNESNKENKEASQG